MMKSELSCIIYSACSELQLCSKMPWPFRSIDEYEVQSKQPPKLRNCIEMSHTKYRVSNATANHGTLLYVLVPPLLVCLMSSA